MVEVRVDFKKIASQQVLDELRNSVYWEHAFLREIYVLSPSFIYPDGGQCYAADVFPNIGLLILTFDSEHPGVEIKALEVSEINVTFNADAALAGTVNESRIELQFGAQRFIRAREAAYRVLAKEDVYGDQIRYGKYWDDLFG